MSTGPDDGPVNDPKPYDSTTSPVGTVETDSPGSESENPASSRRRSR